MFYAVYAYDPLSIKALSYLLIHDTMGETQKFQRQMASGMWAAATGKHLDATAYRPYHEKIFEDYYKSPFGKPQSTETGEDIVNHLLGRG